MRKIIISLSFLAACNDTSLVGSSATQPVDRELPRLDVTAPLRGSIQAGSEPIDVSGSVRDDRPGVHVFVNGVYAKVEADGSFHARIAPSDGMTLVHTVAIDASGKQATDNRAVLNGTLTPVETAVHDGLLVRLDAAAITRAGAAAAARVGASDLVSPLKLMNPLFESALPCDGARVELADLAHGTVKVGLTPQYNGMKVDAEIPDLVATLVVKYSDSCTTMKSTAAIARATRVHVVGAIGVSIGENGELALDTTATSFEIDGFAFDAGLSDRLMLHIQQPLEDALTSFLADKLTAAVPGALMRDLGERLPGDLKATATRLIFDPKGVTYALDTEAEGGGAVYPHAFEVAPKLGTRGLGVAVAADSLNQLVAARWAAGALDAPLTTAGGGYASVELAFHLPPVLGVASGGKDLSVTLGDIEVRFVDAAGATAARVFLSAQAPLTVGASADHMTLSLSPSTVTLFVDPATDRDQEPAKMSATQTQAAADAVTRQLVDRISTVLSRLPLPAATGAMSVGAPLVGNSPVEGYLLLSQ